jgi:hypothetical protein
MIALKDEGKGDTDRMRRKHARTRSILPKNFFVDNFLNDEHQRYLEYFQPNPTITQRMKVDRLIIEMRQTTSVHFCDDL